MKTQKIICKNSFHNSDCIVIARDGKLSTRQMKKIKKNLCGIAGCLCGGFDTYADAATGSKLMVEPDSNGGAMII